MSSARDALVAKIEELAGQAATRCGVEVVEVIYRKQGPHSVLRIDIDRPGLPGVGLAECEAMSRALEPDLDALAGLREETELQVSSPGLDRPIRTSDDIRRNTGRRIVVESAEPIAGQREFRGVLAGERHGGLVVTLDDGTEAEIPLAEVRRAHQDLEIPRRRPKGHG